MVLITGALLVAGGAFMFTFGDEARAEMVSVDGASIAIRPRPGDCIVHDTNMLNGLSRMATASKVLALHVPCADLSGIQAGTKEMSSYVIWTVQTQNGNAVRLPQYTRTRLAKELAQAFPKMSLAELSNDVNRNLQNKGFGFKLNLRMQAVIEEENDAVYVATIGDAQEGLASRVKAGVTGFALVKGYAMSIIAYEDFSGDQTIPRLLVSVKSLTRAVLAENTPQ
jgi:hypothetical protein